MEGSSAWLKSEWIPLNLIPLHPRDFIILQSKKALPINQNMFSVKVRIKKFPRGGVWIWKIHSWVGSLEGSHGSPDLSPAQYLNENKEHKSLHQEALPMLWDEEPMEITQTDRKVGNRVFLQTFSFLFIPSFVKVKTGTEVSSQCPDFACSSLKCCSHPQLSCPCQHGWHQLLVYTGTVSGELCWLGTPRYSTEGRGVLASWAARHFEQANWNGRLVLWMRNCQSVQQDHE